MTHRDKKSIWKPRGETHKETNSVKELLVFRIGRK
jgi:hypothetical protein